MTGRYHLVAVHVGRPRVFRADTLSEHQKSSQPDRPWTSGIIKELVDGPVMVRQTNLEGDEQADLVNHGGVDKAVLAYPLDNYSFWKTEFPSVDWRAGSFGENLALAGVEEDEVCIGDVHQCGDCILQVSQPRQPCWKLSKRWKLPKLAVRVQQTRRTGWYYRVLREGTIEAGQTISLEERSFPTWTVSAANEVMYGKAADPVALRELASCPLLSQSWRETLARRVDRKRPPKPTGQSE